MKTLPVSYRFFFTAFLLFVGLGFLAPPTVHAQKGQTSMGTDFWLGFMPNSFNYGCCPPEGIELFIGTGTANKVWVDAYDGLQNPPEHHYQTMTANSTWTIDAPSEVRWEDYEPEIPAYYAIHVYSQNPIVVYGYQYTGPNTSSTDSYLALPTSGLGTDYYPSCYYDDRYTLGPPNILPGQFMIISPYDDNVVTIGPVKTDTRADADAATASDVTILHHKGDTWSVTLAKGQTYLVQSSGLNYGDGDITGTHIVSTKPIAVVSGHQLCSVPIGELAAQNGSKDEVLEMVPPTNTWGSEYYLMPTATRTICGDMVRVIAGEDNERITENNKDGHPSALLAHAGDFYDFEQIVDPSVFTSEGGKKFLAVQMAYSQGYLGDPGKSDPFSTTLTSQQQFQKKMIFRTPDRAGVLGFVHYGTFICQTDSITKIQINGHPISFYTYAGMLPIPGTNPPMSGYRIQFQGAGQTYIATCGAPFGCYLYGWSQYESYGHPAGMALGTISPDTLPPLEKRDSACGNFQVELLETRHIPQFSFEDTRISDIAMITDTLDARWPRPSYNYSFAFDPNHPFMTGDSTAYFDLTVINPAQDAYAAVWTTDKAGNDTVYQYYYTAPKLDASPASPYSIQPVRVTVDSCENIFFRNTGSRSLQITTASIMGGVDSAGTFTVSPTNLNQQLAPGDSVELTLCFSPSDTMITSDTLLLGVGCTQFKYPLIGLGITPLIIAGDLNFGNILVGDTLCKPITISNVGKAPLTLTKNWSLGDPADFSFSGSALLPVTIPPGRSITLDFCFHPQATGPYQTLQNWGTDLPTPFAHSIKDTSQLLGYGVQAGLNWDRPKQGFWTECSNPVIDTVNLVNPSTGGQGTDITVDSIALTGTDADEFSILGNDKGILPPWVLQKDKTVGVYLQYTPNLTKGYVTRSANLVAYGASGEKAFTPTIALSATVRHATIRITPNAYDFGTVLPGASVTTNFWIHNDGDTTLLLSSLTVDSGWTLSGYTPDESVQPGDSVMVTVSNINAPVGTSFATLTAGSDYVACTPQDSAVMMLTASSFQVAATGYDFGNVYTCLNGSGVVTASDLGSKPAQLISVQILDSLGTTGASQFFFANGSKEIRPDTALSTGESAGFPVVYNPQIGNPVQAYIVFTFVDPVTNDTITKMHSLSGAPLHYVNTLSVQNGKTPSVAYGAYPAQTVDVPVTMWNNSLDDSASVYAIQFTLRYRKDMFEGVGGGNPNVIADDGLTLQANPTTVTDPSDTNYYLTTATVGSTSPITQSDSTIAHLQMEYVLSKDSVSDLEVMNPVYFTQNSDTACWVSHDTIPSEFDGLDRCGGPTLRNFLRGQMVSFSIQHITPNPVAGLSTVGFSVHLDGEPLTMEVYNVLGQRMLTIMRNEQFTSGDHTAPLITTALPAGQYVLRMSDGTTVESRPFVVVK